MPHRMPEISEEPSLFNSTFSREGTMASRFGFWDEGFGLAMTVLEAHKLVHGIV